MWRWWEKDEVDPNGASKCMKLEVQVSREQELVGEEVDANGATNY